MRNYRLKVPTLDNNRIDMITAFLHQYDEFIAHVTAGDNRARGSEYRLQLINAAAKESGFPNEMIEVCCRKASAPKNAAFFRARRGFYLMLSQMLD